VNHLTKYNILSSEQYGFRENLTTKCHLPTDIQDFNSYDNKSKAGGIFSGTEKAFDFVNHNILLLKMQLYRIIGKEIRIIGKEITLCTQYLTDINEYS
jgi:hypothetical protein